jgi:hypothetical protein
VQHTDNSVIIKRIVLGFRRRNGHQRRNIQPLIVQVRAERGGGIVDRLFLLTPLRGAPLVHSLFEIQNELIGRAESVTLARRVSPRK